MAQAPREWQPVRERYGCIEELDPKYSDSVTVMWQANHWLDCDLDYMITLSPSQRQHDRLKLGNPHIFMRTLKRALADADYWGPYVIVLGDNRGSCYWHPHMLCKGEENGKRLETALQRLGDLGTEFNGPLRSAGAFTYLAGRAGENPFEEPYVAERLHWIRRPRPHGRRRSILHE